MNLQTFRQELLTLIHQAKLRQPDAYIHLIYAPEVSDPLELGPDVRRDMALIRAPGSSPNWPGDNMPRVITLDCRRVAGYLLESDPGIDDPLLESSIGQAHADIFHQQADQSLLINEDPGLVQSPICGWIVSLESARRLASRIGSLFSSNFGSGNRKPLRWYDPEFMLALWPTLSCVQQQAVLGNADWIARNSTNGLLHFRTVGGVDEVDPSAHLRLSADQLQTVENVAIVSALMRNWKSMCEEQGGALPVDATQQLHRHIKLGQQHRLDADDLTIYAMTAVQLPPGATAAPEFTQLLSQITAQSVLLRDALQHLPESFWQRHQPLSPQTSI